MWRCGDLANAKHEIGKRKTRIMRLCSSVYLLLVLQLLASLCYVMVLLSDPFLTKLLSLLSVSPWRNHLVPLLWCLEVDTRICHYARSKHLPPRCMQQLRPSGTKRHDAPDEDPPLHVCRANFSLLLVHAPVLLMLIGAFVQLPHFLFSVFFAEAYVGNESRGMRLEVEQVLPRGAWWRISEGGCLLGRAGHLVVEPEKQTVEANLADSDSVGRRLCDWLDSISELHSQSTGATRRRTPKVKGMLGKYFSKGHSEDSFSTVVEVKLHHIDLEDYVESPAIAGHIPLPWASLTFSYYPFGKRDNGRSAQPTYFCGYAKDCNTPTKVYVLLSPEVSETLRNEQEAEVPFNPTPRNSASKEEDDEPEEGEIPSQLNNSFQMLPVRTFHWLEPECVSLDGRFVAAEAELCTWAAQQRNDFPSASATLIFKSVSLFIDRYANVTGRLQLENPAYRLYARKITLYIKPLQSRAILTRRHYYDSL